MYFWCIICDTLVIFVNNIRILAEIKIMVDPIKSTVHIVPINEHEVNITYSTRVVFKIEGKYVFMLYAIYGHEFYS